MTTSYVRWLVVINGAVPLAVLAWDAYRGQLGANPVNHALHITGLVSLIFLLLSLAITPLRVLTGWSGWIALRRSLGLYGFAYAAVHLGIYVFGDRMGDLASTWGEIVSRRFLTVGFIALALMVPLAITSTNTMIRWMGAVPWKRLHRLAYVIAVLSVLHYYMLVKSDIRSPFAFAAVLAPLLGFRVGSRYWDQRRRSPKSSGRLTRGARKSEFFQGELMVAEIIDETADVKTFRLVTKDRTEIPFRHRPGQYLTLEVSVAGKRVRRSYTIASSPTQRDRIEVTIKRQPDGYVSRHLHDEVDPGDVIRIRAPGGSFWFDGQSSQSVVLIAGGVGITPLMSMLRYLADQQWQGHVYFINAMRTIDDWIFEAEVRAIADRLPGLQWVQCITRTPESELDVGPDRHATTSGSKIQLRSGYVTEELLRECVPNMRAMPVYLCGPFAMMQTITELLLRMGVDASQIHREAFLSPNANVEEDQRDAESPEGVEEVCEAATVDFTKSGTEASIEVSQTILEVAEEHGVEIPSECRSGICGQCKVRCLSGRVSMEVTDALSSSEIRSGWILACQARATTESVQIDA